MSKKIKAIILLSALLLVVIQPESTEIATNADGLYAGIFEEIFI